MDSMLEYKCINCHSRYFRKERPSDQELLECLNCGKIQSYVGKEVDKCLPEDMHFIKPGSELEKELDNILKPICERIIELWEKHNAEKK